MSVVKNRGAIWRIIGQVYSSQVVFEAEEGDATYARGFNVAL
jgi:hypothetical protein